MTDLDATQNAKSAAQQVLLAATRRVGDSLPTFSAWLLAGFGAAFSLVLANVDKVTKFIEITHIRFGLVVFLLSLAVAVIATYLSTIGKAALGAQEDAEALGKKLAETKAGMDVGVFLHEYQRGLIPPIRWFARRSMSKAKSGDIVASARMIAKLSQVQALLVLSQSILALVGVGALVFGLKME
jgi:hypothetical protein